MDIKTFYRSKDFKRTMLALLVVVLILASFGVGVEMGERRAEFGEHLSGQYSRMFIGRGGASIFGGLTRPAPLGYGASGKVVAISGNTLTVALADNTERLVRIEPDTLIREFGNTGTTTDLKINDSVIVIGSPDADGDIVAKLIRVL